MNGKEFEERLRKVEEAVEQKVASLTAANQQLTEALNASGENRKTLCEDNEKLLKEADELRSKLKRYAALEEFFGGMISEKLIVSKALTATIKPESIGVVATVPQFTLVRKKPPMLIQSKEPLGRVITLYLENYFSEERNANNVYEYANKMKGWSIPRVGVDMALKSLTDWEYLKRNMKDRFFYMNNVDPKSLNIPVKEEA